VEYGHKSINPATKAFVSGSALSERFDMGIAAGMARLDQYFEYSGLASDKLEGYPGYTGAALT
jgi:hypothetical protein